MSRKPAIEPRVWRPPPAPSHARQSRGPVPVELTVVETPGPGPEDVAVDASGHVYAGIADGRILRISPDGRHLDTVADTGGRPLGIELDPDGDLIVCDARRGLLNVSGGVVRTVVDRVAGRPMAFCNNSAIARDGTIYFTDSSAHLGIDHWRGELLAHSGTGRLLRRTPDGAVHVLVDGLQFANGVALAPDESFVAVAETAAYRVTRLWPSGRRDTLVESLPGFPDNISTGSDGLIWVTLAAPRDRVLDAALPRAPIIRKIAWRLPEALQPHERRTVWVQAYDVDGTLVHDLQTRHDWFHLVTGVREVDGTVWLGSLVARGVGRISL